MGQLLRSTERISSYKHVFYPKLSSGITFSVTDAERQRRSAGTNYTVW